MKDRALTAKQIHVLNVFADGRPYSITDWVAWYPMHSDQVRSVMRSLWHRGLVDVAGFEGRSRTYAITDKGSAAIEKIENSSEVAAMREP